MKYKEELKDVDEEKYSYDQIESIFSSQLHSTDFPILLNSVGRQEKLTKEDWIDIFFEKLEKEIKWPQ